MPEAHPPRRDTKAFDCPYCGVYAWQNWIDVYEDVSRVEYGEEGNFAVSHLFRRSRCFHCKEEAVWVGDEMVHPLLTTAPSAHPDLPEAVRADFDEARDIVGRSPRGAAALLRLVIQKLCAELGETGKYINEDIASLVKKGSIHPRVQKALDSVRVIGNEAVHPGEIDLRDNHELALSLFKLVNLIVQEAITKDREIDEIFSSLPQDKLDAIMRRDTRWLTAKATSTEAEVSSNGAS